MNDKIKIKFGNIEAEISGTTATITAICVAACLILAMWSIYI